jgi:tetratricopeptide (TPR) repeat protein
VLLNKQYYYWVEGAAFVGKSTWKDAIEALTAQVDVLTSIAYSTRMASDETTLASALRTLGGVFQQSGDNAKAGVQFGKAADAITRALSVNQTDPDTVHEAVQVQGAQFGLMTFPADLPKAFPRVEWASTLVWNALVQEPWNVDLQGDLTRVISWLTSAKSMLPTAGLPAADASAMSSRIDPMLANRQLSKVVNWIIRPLMPGAWRNLVDQDKDLQLSKARALVRSAYPDIHTDQIIAVRAMQLPFRKGGDVLYEAGVESDNGERSIVAFVDSLASDQSSGRFALIDGSFSPVYQLNAKGAPQLDTAAQAEAYFRFVAGVFHGNLGPYALVERPEDLLWLADASEETRASARKSLAPVKVTRESDGSWAMTATLTYGTTLYSQRQTVNATGQVDFGDLTRLMSDLPVAIESMTANAKTLRGILDMLPRVLASDLKKLETTPNDAELLADAVRMNERLGRRADAAPLQARIVEVLKANKDTKKDALLNAYISLSWYQLFARDFDGTLASAAAGHEIDPNDLFLETNRAHALLFKGQIREAEAVYRAHLGKKLSATSNLIWEAAILQDFDDLEKAGITSPNVARIKKIMGAGR